MKNWKSLIPKLGTAILSLALTALLISGCGLNDAPTASNDEPTQTGNFWNPEPGDEVESGREVPILNDGYWESMYGPQINPWLIRPGGDLGGIGGIDGITAATRTIMGDTGGRVTLGNHSYFVPAGAVNGVVEFTLDYASITGVGVDCGPSPMSFDTPVILTLSFEGTQYDNDLADPSDLRIFYVDEDGDTHVLEDCEVNTRDNTVTAPVLHFSRYILG